MEYHCAVHGDVHRERPRKCWALVSGDGYHLLRSAPALQNSPPPLLCLQHNLKAEPSCRSWPALQVKAEGAGPDSPFFVSQRRVKFCKQGMSSHVGTECPGQIILSWQASVSQKASVPQGQFFLPKVGS